MFYIYRVAERRVNVLLILFEYKLEWIVTNSNIPSENADMSNEKG